MEDWQEAKAKETANILTLNQQHRDLWSRAQDRSELARVFLGDADSARP